jgi:hypothetical protein
MCPELQLMVVGVVKKRTMAWKDVARRDVCRNVFE